MRGYKPRRQQRRLRHGGKRKTIGTGAVRAIRTEVDRESRRWNVSKSFVISCALAAYFDVADHEVYNQPPPGHPDFTKRS